MKKNLFNPLAITSWFKQAIDDQVIDADQFLNGTELADQLASSRFAKALEDPGWNADCKIRYVSLQQKTREIVPKRVITGLRTTNATTVRGLERAMRKCGDDIPIAVDSEGMQYLFYAVMGYHNTRNLCVIVLKPLSALAKKKR